jgi:hypothetical protein
MDNLKRFIERCKCDLNQNCHIITYWPQKASGLGLKDNESMVRVLLRLSAVEEFNPYVIWVDQQCDYQE